jgi:diadenylate cyclase
MLNEWTLREVLSVTLDIAVIYFLVYRVFLIIKGTRAVPMLVGLMGIAFLYGVSQEVFLDLPTFNWLLQQFIGSILIIVVVLFQGDIRRALAAFGQTQFLTSSSSASDSQVIDELVKACGSLSNQKIGALLVLERDADLSPYAEEGTRVDAKVSKELVYSLFVPERQSPLHDGAIVIQNGRLAVAGVFLPMSVNPTIDRSFGTRHRAALGLSEETDAVVIVVSEERGVISLAVDGVLESDVGLNNLREQLTTLLIRPTSGFFRRSRSSPMDSAAVGDELATEPKSGSERLG